MPGQVDVLHAGLYTSGKGSGMGHRDTEFMDAWKAPAAGAPMFS